MLRLLAVPILMLSLSGCQRSADPLDEYQTTVVTLPDGQKVRCEVMRERVDMARGMMFRDKLDPDRGMLFIHGSENRYPYYMFQTRIPLDIIWMDKNKRVVEISADTPPCTKDKSAECPNYGGSVNSLIVLEMAAGSARKHGIDVGDAISY